MGDTLKAESAFQCEVFVEMPIEDRIRTCRAMALEAKELAARSEHDLREVYSDLARQWSTLADEMLCSHKLSA